MAAEQAEVVEFDDKPVKEDRDVLLGVYRPGCFIVVGSGDLGFEDLGNNSSPPLQAGDCALIVSSRMNGNHHIDFLVLSSRRGLGWVFGEALLARCNVVC